MSIQEILDAMFEDVKDKLPKIDFKNIKLDDNQTFESRGMRFGHSFRFRLSQITQSVKLMSWKKGTGEARARSELRYNATLRTMIKDSDSMSRISRNSDIYVDREGNASLIITDYSALTKSDKEGIELYAVLHGLDVRRTE